MLIELGLILIFCAWAYQFVAMLRGIDAASRAPQPLFAGLFMLGTGVLIYDALSSARYLVGYVQLAVFLAALAVFVQSFKR